MKGAKMLSFDMEEISSIMNDISLIAKIKFDLYDKDFNILHGDGSAMCSLCTLVRSCPECHRKCIESDRLGFAYSEKTAKAYTYKCHMGLTETVTPIICEDSIVGYLMIGQKLMREDFETVRKNVEKFPDEEKREEMLEALGKMKYTTVDELDAMCNLVKICSSYLQMKKLVKHRETPISVLLKNYIIEHISDDLDVKKLCREFKMSKSSLYLLSKDAFGKGITEYAEELRIEKAKELLRTAVDPISAVAEQVGYSDSNYFTKVFKKHTQVTPSVWRKANNGING